MTTSNDKFEFTENSAKSVVEGEMASMKARAIIDEGKAAGKSMEEIGKEVFALSSLEQKKAFGKLIVIVNLLTQMGYDFNMGTIEQQSMRRFDEPLLVNHAFYGYRAVIQHYVDSEPAKKWEAFFASAETIGDVYRYFLEENNLTYDYASSLPSYSILDVEEILAIRLDNKASINFGINKTLWNDRNVRDQSWDKDKPS